MRKDYSVDSLLGRNSFDLAGVKSGHDDISVVDLGDVGDIVEPGKSVLHPLLVVSLREVVSGMGTTRFLSVFGSIDSHLSLKKEVLELKCLNQISVPDVASVRNSDMLVLLGDIVELLAALLEKILTSENSSVSLHGLLHGESDLSSRFSSL
jgi:hypothetical protein